MKNPRHLPPKSPARPALPLALLTAAAAALTANPAGAQTFERDFDAPESWAMKYFAAASILTAYGPQPVREPGHLDLGFEVVQIPRLDRGYREVGFGGMKEENLNNAPVLMRPRVTVYLQENFSASFSYVPPVEMWDVEAHLLAGSLDWTFYRGERCSLGLRFYGQRGYANGMFTCDDDLVATDFRCTETSNDRVHLNHYGAEINAAYRTDIWGGLTPFAGIGFTHMDLHIDIDNAGPLGPSTEETRGDAVHFTAGFNVPLTERATFGLQAFYSPLKVERASGRQEDSLVHVRAQVTYAFGDLREIFRRR